MAHPASAAEGEGRDMSIHVLHKSESQASVLSTATDYGAEHVVDSGVRLPPGTPTRRAAVRELRPTQLAVGMQQVQEKMAKVSKKVAKGPDALERFLQGHPVPVVLGPGGGQFLIDHHHLCLGLVRLGIQHAYVGTVADLSGLSEEQFWPAMQRRGFLWPYRPDGSGPVPPAELRGLLPRSLEGLEDDPYRSLAALVRKAGGYHKSGRPFSEFIWAGYLRPRVPMLLTQPADVEAYVHRGVALATAAEAAGLPGFSPLSAATEQQLDLMGTLGREELGAGAG